MRPEGYPAELNPPRASRPEHPLPPGSAPLHAARPDAACDIALLAGTYAALNELVTLVRESQTAFDLGLDDLVIFLTILTGNLQRWHRGGQQPPEHPATALESALVPMSQSAISRATGIARETVRRRVRHLESRAIIRIDARGAATVQPAFVARFLAQPPLRKLMYGFKANDQPTG